MQTSPRASRLLAKAPFSRFRENEKQTDRRKPRAGGWRDVGIQLNKEKRGRDFANCEILSFWRLGRKSTGIGTRAVCVNFWSRDRFYRGSPRDLARRILQCSTKISSKYGERINIIMQAPIVLTIEVTWRLPLNNSSFLIYDTGT